MSQSPTASRRLLPEGLRVLYMSSGRESFTLLTEPEAGSGRCPLCDSRSAQVHSRYSRTIADLPWRGVEVKLQVRARKFFCLNRSCARRVFCERLPDIGVRARKTGRLEQVLIKIASGLGGEAGARLARELGLLVGPDALLERIRRMPTTDQEQVRVLGVDDFALKRGRDYGTILVDLERHRVIDLLPERSADVLAEWLEQHPGIEVVSRDRSVVYAEGIARGAPDCTQVADRWHLLKNLTDTLQRTLEHNRHHLKVRPGEVEDTGEGRDSEGSDEKPPGELSGCYGRRPCKDGLVQDARRERRKEAYERAVVLRGRGLTIKAISTEVGVSKRTLHRWFAVGEFPERRPRSDKGPRLPRQYAEHVIRRWREGCRNVSQLHREIREEGYDRSIRTLYVFAAYLRAGQPPPGYDSPPTAKDPDERRRSGRVGRPNTEQISARRGAWSLTLSQEDLGSKEQRWLEQVLDEWSYGPVVRRLAREFVEMVREGKSEKLEDWIGDAECCGVSELKGLAQGLLQDYDAVSAALSMAWSNGQVEGQVHRLKLVKRAMYGRAGFDLLKRRVMEAA